MDITYYQHKTIWITGASSGIGKALAESLDIEHCKIVLSSRNERNLEALADSFKHAQTLVLPLDLSQSSNFKSLAAQVHQHFGSIDLLINNGGISQRSRVEDTSEAVERQIMEINYFGNIALSKAVLPYFQTQKSGQFAIVSSIAGKFGFFLRSSYSASKHALHGYYESLRLEEEHHNIKVSLVCPGKIKTDISKNALTGNGKAHDTMDSNQEFGMPSEECAQRILVGLTKNKLELFIGRNEIKSVKLKRLFPSIFHKILRKQKIS